MLSVLKKGHNLKCGGNAGKKKIPQMTEFSSDSYSVYVHCCAILKDKLYKLIKV